jgi:uncharacterized protein YjiK
MPHARFSTLCAALAGLLVLVTRPATAQAPDVPQSVGYTDWQYAADYPLTEVPEPSGLCFVPGRGTLFVVDDGGPGRPPGVYEVSLDGKVLQKREVGKDMEGVCYCSADGLLYAADEAGERVWVLEPDGLKVRGSFTVSREFNGTEVLAAGGNGFEGIEYIPSAADHPRDYFLLLNQDDPQALVRIERKDIALDKTVAMTRFTPLSKLNCGELYYDDAMAQLWVVHSWLNLYEVLDIDSLAVLDWQVCPGMAQEGLCFDDQGRLWIGSDSGGIAVYTRQGPLERTASASDPRCRAPSACRVYDRPAIIDG